MSKHIKTGSLLVLCCWATLLTGCFPEDSLEWSNDGSLGLLRIDTGLYLVDGQSGERTAVCEGAILPWPGLSADGTTIVYGQEVACASLAEGLKALPAAQVAMIENDVERVRDSVLSNTFDADRFLWNDANPFGFSDPYRSWVARYVCERSGAPVTQRLGAELLAKGRETDLSFNQLIVVARDNLKDRKVVVTNMLPILRPRFSPDGRYIAYVTPGRHDGDNGTLSVVSADGESGAVEVNGAVAITYDWRPDSRALAYVKQDGDPILGVIEEKTIADEAGTLLAELVTEPTTAPVGIYRCAGEGKQLAGTLFQAMMKVQHGSAGRLFFSSPSVKIPTSDLDEPIYSLFCYDFLTGTAVNVLPASVSDLAGDMMNFFALSPDGTKVLLPMTKHRFAIYTLGEKTPVVPIDEADAFGEDMPDMLPAWKGNTQISCLVSGQSRFLDGTQGQEEHEIVVLNADGSFQTHLSKGWPDDEMP